MKHWKKRRYLRKKVLRIDSTQITLSKVLNLSPSEVPLLDKEKNGIKIHLAALMGKMVQPLSAIVTPDNVHDSSEFEELLSDVDLFEKLSELILVMDKGYTNYDRYKELDDRDISFVVRRSKAPALTRQVCLVIQLKKNAKYTVISSEKHREYIDYRIRLEKNGLELRMVEYNGEFKEWTFITNISSDELSGHGSGEQVPFYLEAYLPIDMRGLLLCYPRSHYGYQRDIPDEQDKVLPSSLSTGIPLEFH